MITLEPNESIVLQVRRHWFSLFLRLLPLVLCAVIPIFLFGFVQTLLFKGGGFGNENAGELSFSVFLLFSWILFVWIGAFVVWTDYFLDVLVVTNKRIINTEQKALFSREISSLRLDKIQDVTIDISGILATFLLFGNIRIQTAGEQEEFMIRFIKDPESLKNTILKEHDRVIEELREVRIVK